MRSFESSISNTPAVSTDPTSATASCITLVQVSTVRLNPIFFVQYNTAGGGGGGAGSAAAVAKRARRAAAAANVKWALGTVLWEIATCSTPPYADTDTDQVGCYFCCCGKQFIPLPFFAPIHFHFSLFLSLFLSLYHAYTTDISFILLSVVATSHRCAFLCLPLSSVYRRWFGRSSLAAVVRK